MRGQPAASSSAAARTWHRPARPSCGTQAHGLQESQILETSTDCIDCKDCTDCNRTNCNDCNDSTKATTQDERPTCRIIECNGTHLASTSASIMWNTSARIARI